MPTTPNDNVLGRLAKPRRAPEPTPEPEPPPTPSPADPPAPRVKKKARPKPKDPTNYKGDGLYAFKGADAKKLVAYVGPDVHRAVKMAAADRQLTMSEIVDETMRAAGYGGPREDA